MSWTMYGGGESGTLPGGAKNPAPFLHVSPWPQTIRALGSAPQEVRVTEGDGLYYGWVRRGEEMPTMIASHRAAYEILFPSGSAAEERVGNGRTIRLVVEVAG